MKISLNYIEIFYVLKSDYIFNNIRIWLVVLN